MVSTKALFFKWQKAQISPIDELNELLKRLDHRLNRAKQAYIESIRSESEPKRRSRNKQTRNKQTRNKQTSSFFGFTSIATESTTRPATTTPPAPTLTDSYDSSSSSSNDEEECHPSTKDSSTTRRDVDCESETTEVSSTTRTTTENKAQGANEKAKFIDIPDQEQLIADLQRITELVVIGENYVTQQEKKRQEELEKSRERWSADRDLIDSIDIDVDIGSETQANEKDAPSPDFADVFDLFFERHSPAILVALLTGRGFDSPEIDEIVAKSRERVKTNGDKPTNIVEHCILLPDLPVAIQAVQSITMLVENVSRATSLYMLFSNDFINDIINLNLDMYERAERARHTQAGGGEGFSTSIHASPEMEEFTMHFVNFLKSLALRMNAETLQFFLQYPKSAYNPAVANTAQPLVDKFPLYDRALDFSATHEDTYARVTAMNICLSTIRLTTAPGPEVLDVNDGGESAVLPSTSPATLSEAMHKAQVLPYRDRLAIAQYTCTPSRVERLTAPVFMKLSESVLASDARKQSSTSKQLKERVAKVKDKVKKEDTPNTTSRDRTADLHDELLILEDVFKVGLTLLNEQIELGIIANHQPVPDA